MSFNYLVKFANYCEIKYRNIMRKASLLGSTEKIQLGDDVIVLFSSGAKKHVSSHAKPGLGSVFAGGDFTDTIVNEISKLSISGPGGVFLVDVPGIGYDLVMPYERASLLPDASETEVVKKERGGDVAVPAFKTSAPLETFATSDLSIVIRPTKDAAFLPDDMKEDPEVLRAMEEGKLYSVLSAWPGAGNVPPASQWGKDWAVVIPDQTDDEPSDLDRI